MVRSIFWSVTLVLIIATLSLASAAPDGNKGKPGGGDGGPTCTPDALFPDLIYPVSSAANNGTYDLAVASSDGCLTLTLEHGVQLGGVRLIAEAYAWRGDVDQAFRWLDTAYEQRDAGLAEILFHPLLANLKLDPRWAAFLDKMGLPH